MTIILRTRLGPGVGFGHFVRQIALAEALLSRGRDVEICLDQGMQDHVPQDMQGIAPITEIADDAAFLVHIRTRTPAAVVLDHYDFTRDLEQAIRASGIKLVVQEDLPVRPHDCDLLVDQSLGRDGDAYSGLVPPDCTILCGQDYALLRQAFATRRKGGLQQGAFPPGRVLVMGGSMNQTGMVNTVLPSISHVWPGATLVVVSGAAPFHADRIEEGLTAHPGHTEWLRNVGDMPSLYASCDFVIGAGGVEVLERCTLGLPSVTIQTADNQAGNCRGAAASGAALVLQDGMELAVQLQEALRQLDADKISGMQQAAWALCDGQGAMRVAAALDRL